MELERQVARVAAQRSIGHLAVVPSLAIVIALAPLGCRTDDLATQTVSIRFSGQSATNTGFAERQEVSDVMLLAELQRVMEHLLAAQAPMDEVAAQVLFEERWELYI
jgi:hypothetical protein